MESVASRRQARRLSETLSGTSLAEELAEAVCPRTQNPRKRHRQDATLLWLGRASRWSRPRVVAWMRELAAETICFPQRFQLRSGGDSPSCSAIRRRIEQLFGDRAPAVLEHFAGQTHVYPLAAEVEEIAREQQIVVALRNDPSTEAVGRLASMLGLTKRDISKIFAAATGRGLQRERERHLSPCLN